MTEIATTKVEILYDPKAYELEGHLIASGWDSRFLAHWAALFYLNVINRQKLEETLQPWEVQLILDRR